MSNNISFIELNSYVRPKIEENKQKNWVLNGRNNSFYQYIIDRNNGSPTNSAINESYINLIYGKGLRAKNLGNKLNDWLILKRALKNTDLRAIIADFQLFGEASFQVVGTKKKDLSGIYHVPKQNIAPSIVNEDGEIDTYFYSKDWCNLNKYPAEPFPSFNKNEAISIYNIKPYKAGKEYFSDPDYLAGLPYAQMEEEIANYCLSHIKNGLSFGYIINIPNAENYTPEEIEKLKKEIRSQLTGSSNAGKFLLAFNSGDKNITVEVIAVNDAHKQWQFLTEEARQQLIVAHKVTSPMLFGIKDNTGLGNNADELDTAEAQLMKRIIAPKQAYIIDALEDVLLQYGINLELEFIPLSEKTTQTPTTNLSSEKKNLDSTVADALIDLGEDSLGNEWEFVDSQIVTNETQLKEVNTGTAKPNASDPQDGEQFKSRYRYQGEITDKSREFCKKMIKANKLYRLSDINKMSENVVNEGWGPNGTNTYDILLYKGGGGCHHYWVRETYRKKADVNNPNAEKITPAQARKAGEILPTVDKKAYEKPVNMPNKGFLPK